MMKEFRISNERQKKVMRFFKDKVSTTRIEREILLLKMRGNGQRKIYLKCLQNFYF